MTTNTPKHSIWSGAFWKATAERTIGTAAAATISVVTVDAFVEGFSEEAWWTVAVAAGVTVLKSLVANTISGEGPGFGDVEVLTGDTTSVLPPQE